MRTLRLSLAGTVILALLGGVSAGTVAQDKSDASVSTASAVLSFTMPYVGPPRNATFEIVEDGLLYREHVYTSTIDAGDPRLDGELWTIQSYKRFNDSGAVIGAGFAGIDLEAGAWRGTYRSCHNHVALPGQRSLYQIDMTGEGAYDGLSVVLFLIDNGTSHDVEGVIFPGEMPLLPEMKEPPAE